jgi:hypothetical protein
MPIYPAKKNQAIIPPNPLAIPRHNYPGQTPRQIH